MENQTTSNKQPSNRSVTDHRARPLSPIQNQTAPSARPSTVGRQYSDAPQSEPHHSEGSQSEPLRSDTTQSDAPRTRQDAPQSDPLQSESDLYQCPNSRRSQWRSSTDGIPLLV